jgi:hypothetical protein
MLDKLLQQRGIFQRRHIARAAHLVGETAESSVKNS